MSNIYDITMYRIDKFIEESQPIRNTDEETSAYFMYLAFNDYFRLFRETIYNPFFIEEMKKAIKYGKDKDSLNYSLTSSVNMNDSEFHVLPVFFCDYNNNNNYEKYAIVFRFDERGIYQLAVFQDKDDDEHYRYNPLYYYQNSFNNYSIISCYATQDFNNNFYSNIKDYIDNVFQIMNKYDKYGELLNGIPIMNKSGFEFYSKYDLKIDIFKGEIFFNRNGICNYSISVNNVDRDFVDAIWNDERISIREKLEKNKYELLKRIPLQTEGFDSIIKMFYDEIKDWKPSEDVIKQYTLK